MSYNVKTMETEFGGTCVIVSDFIGQNLNDNELEKKIVNFAKNGGLIFEKIMEREIRRVLYQIGIIILDNRKSSLESAFERLKTEFGKKLVIEDRELYAQGRKIAVKPYMTILYENGYLELANEITLVNIS